MLYYRVAGLRVAVDEVPGIPPMENFEPFACEAGPADIRYHIRPYPPDCSPVPPEADMILVSQDVVNRSYLCGGMLYKRVAMQEGDSRLMWFAQRVGEWGEATIYLPDNWLDYIGLGNGFAFEKTLLPFGGLMLHCALIEHEGRGIAFSAPSQTGKSTQARLWAQHRGAAVLNGDRAILRRSDGVLWAYGSPYAGSSNLFLNTRVPLCAIIMLEQAKENAIRPIPQEEGLGLFLSQSSLPLWQPELFEMGLSALEDVLSSVPMYMLSCRPDEGAVECVYECLKE